MPTDTNVAKALDILRLYLINITQNLYLGSKVFPQKMILCM